MKRFFKVKKNRFSRASGLDERPSRAERQSSRDDSIGVTTMTNELAGFKLPSKKATEPNQATKKSSYAASTGSDRKSKGSSTDKKRTSGSAGTSKSKEDEKPVALPTKSKSKEVEKKANGNRALSPSSPPVKENVDEVVVPESNSEDRHATISMAYDSIPLLEQTKLPRGGISIETKAVGMVQVRKAGLALVDCFCKLVFAASNPCRMSFLTVWYPTRNNQR